MNRALFSLLAAVLLTACAPGVAENPPIMVQAGPERPATSVTLPDEVRAVERPADEPACSAQGGDWRPVCRMQRPACVTTFDDGGKACSDGSECESGRCLADGMVEAGVQTTGTCAPNDDPCGCSTAIVAGVTEAGICVD